jgi:hypothetical protein
MSRRAICRSMDALGRSLVVSARSCRRSQPGRHRRRRPGLLLPAPRQPRAHRRPVAVPRRLARLAPQRFEGGAHFLIGHVGELSDRPEPVQHPVDHPGVGPARVRVPAPRGRQEGVGRSLERDSRGVGGSGPRTSHLPDNAPECRTRRAIETTGRSTVSYPDAPDNGPLSTHCRGPAPASPSHDRLTGTTPPWRRPRRTSRRQGRARSDGQDPDSASEQKEAPGALAISPQCLGRPHALPRSPPRCWSRLGSMS